MLITTSADAARETEKVQMVNNRAYRSRAYVGTQPNTADKNYGAGTVRTMEPQGFLVFQPANTTTRPHFHQTNQFQVFTGGSGTVGRRRADPVTIQFAGPNTTYGPIVSEDEGIQYFTLRQSWDPGAQYMPEERAKLLKGLKRQIIAVRDPAQFTTPGSAGDARTQTLIAPQPDGLAAHLFIVPPNTRTVLPDAADGGGQYQVVVSGSLMRGDQELGELSVEYAFPDEGSVPVTAGASGLELLVLRFPVAA